jgi:hypothetical protein
MCLIVKSATDKFDNFQNFDHKKTPMAFQTEDKSTIPKRIVLFDAS